METETQIIPREKRFDVADLTGLDAIVSRADSQEDCYFAQVIDFSRTGVKFSVPFFAKFDEFLKIEFKFKNSSLHYAGTGRVRHIRNIEPNRWQVGCSIDPPVPDDVVAYMVKTTNQERRRFERVEVDGQGSLLRQGTIEGCEASLINVSEGGLCLSVEQEHETGQRVDFLIENQKGSEEVIAARVRWQSNVDGGYHLGCSFADSRSHTKLVDCLIEKQQAAEGDRVNWFVAAAILFAMFLPPAAYFLFGTASNESQSAYIAQIADAEFHSDIELPGGSETESIPASNELLATQTNDRSNQQDPIIQQDSTSLKTGTAPKTAASVAPAAPPMNVDMPISIELVDNKSGSEKERDFRQPWGEPPADFGPAPGPSGTTEVLKPSEIRQPGIVAGPSPAAIGEANSKTTTAPIEINSSGFDKNGDTDSRQASAVIEKQVTSMPTVSKSESSKSDISKYEIPKSQISRPAVPKTEISQRLDKDLNGRPMPPPELLASGPKKVHVIKGTLPKKSGTIPIARDLLPIGSGSKVDAASTRRLKSTQSLQVPSEVISEHPSGH